ncbi:MAG: hypothetical protein KDK62_01130 [Chlamydiia bacterium]|nr:hypothetical protein [Chlamydiia bacterium]
MRFFLILGLIFSVGHIKMLYNSLDPSSLHEHLAFWELYPDTTEGEKALGVVKQLLQAENIDHDSFKGNFQSVLQGMVTLVNKPGEDATPILDYKTLDFVQNAAKNLSNRRLKGYWAVTEEEVIKLPPEEIDLARGLFLSELGAENFDKIRSYEAMLDLMALQIQARLTPGASDREKVELLNRYIFEELGFRFPPHSTYSEDIDLYTFLPSVMDSRRGVCLGVSILYITLAQRIDLELEMVTPPGHIYVRSGDINIETTARGVDMDDEVYLGVDTRSLQVRDVKEVIGLAHFNQAAVFWRKKDPKKAIEIYSRGRPYLKEDPLLLELIGYNYILDGDETTGRDYLERVKDHVPDFSVSENTVPRDYLEGKADKEALAAIYKEVDEKRSSLLEKRDELIKTCQRCPEFKAGWFALGTTYLQLHRMKEALGALRELHRIYPDDPNAEYYLAVLSAERDEFSEAWKHLKQAEKLTKARFHHPKALVELRRQLSIVFPEPL